MTERLMVWWERRPVGDLRLSPDGALLFRYDKGRRDLGVDLSVGVDEKRLPMLADALNGTLVPPGGTVTAPPRPASPRVS